MREDLSTVPAARRHGSGLSGSIFSGPDDCTDLVFSFQAHDNIEFFRDFRKNFDAGGAREKEHRSNCTFCCSPVDHKACVVLYQSVDFFGGGDVVAAPLRRLIRLAVIVLRNLSLQGMSERQQAAHVWLSRGAIQKAKTAE
ncbi:MAG: hypothetical protein JJU08_17585 [Rhodobacteraceae bacterium]|nr:hypothetical protein [Paracoccaceae bacterium]